MDESLELLRRYVDGASEEAFRELVARHMELVYSTAVRRVGGDKHVAEDIVQTVFADLARKARWLSGGIVLAGWLYRHTCFVAASMVRADHRRQTRERHALEMNEQNQDPAPAWEQLAPFLDEGLASLKAGDRDAIVLRYLERRDLRTVGAALGLNDDAAQKRVARALDKLRIFLKRRGLPLSAAALVASLTSGGVIPVSAGLVATVANTALASAAVGSGVTFTFLKLMTMAKLKAGVLAGIALAGVATPLLLQQQSLTRLRTENEALRQATRQIAQPGDQEERLGRFKTDAGESDRLSKEHDELMRLREEAVRLRQQSQQVSSRQADQPRKIEPDIRPTQTSAQIFPSESWANAGLASPEASLQTLFWAMQNGDANRVRGITDWHIGGDKPESNDVEDAIQTTLARSFGFVSELKEIRILSQETDKPDAVKMSLQATSESGQTGPFTLHFSLTNEQWKPVFSGWRQEDANSSRVMVGVPFGPEILTPAK